MPRPPSQLTRVYAARTDPAQMKKMVGRIPQLSTFAIFCRSDRSPFKSTGLVK